MSAQRWTIVFLSILVLSYLYLLLIIPARSADNYLQSPFDDPDFLIQGDSLTSFPPRSDDTCENLLQHDWFVLSNLLYDEQLFAKQFRSQLRRENRRPDIQFRRAMRWLFVGEELPLSARLASQLQTYNNTYSTRLDWSRVMQAQQESLECFDSIERLVLSPNQVTYDSLANPINGDMYLYIHTPAWLAINPREVRLKPQEEVRMAWQARCPEQVRYDFAVEVIIFRFPLPPIAKEAFLLCR